MMGLFDDLFNPKPPSDEMIALLREARSHLKSLPEHVGATERMRKCPHSFCEEVCGELWWSCDTAPYFCQWSCVLYDQETCLMEGDEHRGVRVYGIECLTG